MMRDTFFQALEYSRKAARLLGRRLIKKNLFNGNVKRWSAEGDVRALEISRRSLEYCIKEGIIRRGTELAMVPYDVLGRMIQVYMLAERLEHWREPVTESKGKR